MSAEIKDLVAQRRRALGTIAQGEGLWGLALSGGGIRSATFCFGLLRGLAAQRLLLRFDLMSTVSGGGYIGAMLGRLFQRASGPADVGRIVDHLHQAHQRWFAWWLRANGRYLVPRGARDTAFAVALYARNMIGVHVELGVLGLLVGAALAAINLGVWQVLDAQVGRHPDATLSWIRQWPDWVTTWLPTPWLLLPLLAWAACVLLCAFWSLPWVARKAATPAALADGASLMDHLRHRLQGDQAAAACRWMLVLAALAALLVGRDYAVGPLNGQAQVLRQWLWALAVLTLAAWVPALALARHWARAASERPLARNRLTEALASLLRLAVLVLVVGLLDRFAWLLAFESLSLPELATVLAVAAAALRAVLPLFSAAKGGGLGLGVMLRIGGALGYGITFLLFACWVSLFQQVVMGSLLVDAAAELAGPGRRHVVDFSGAWQAWAWMALPAIVYAAFGGRNVGFLNQSSLHGFYRARLVRSYLGAANPKRFGRPTPLGATHRMSGRAMASHPKAAVTQVESDDDVPFADYAPHRHGGPVHLIGVCLNETRDPRGGLFNQDRRGQALTLAPGGLMRVGQQAWEKVQAARGLSLGSWMAISGAAVAPGLGALTRGGVSALAMFGGLRLGYWWDSSARQGHAAVPRRPWSKLAGVVRETVGNFGGPGARDWFLTDGGHFENTGAFALLAEEAELIVLADCGADPDFSFDDIENLVRKARIDLQAEVRFQRPRDSTSAVLPLNQTTRDFLGQFGSLADLASNTSLACFALAEIRYRRGSPKERIGHLILVKPNLCAGLPVDLFNFKAKQPDFPQQSTADQFFDEAQWESYFQLGSVLGSRLDQSSIKAMLQLADTLFVRDDGTPVAQAAEASLESATAAASAAAAERPLATAISRIPQRIAAGSVGATLSLGAVATVGVSAWQAIDALRAAVGQRVKDERAALKELTDLWAPPARSAPSDDSTQTTAQTAALATVLLRLSDTLCPAGDGRWFVESPLANNILVDALKRCEDTAQARVEPACHWLRNSAQEVSPMAVPSCLKQGLDDASKRASEPCFHYWAYDYGSVAKARCAHPSDGGLRIKLALAQTSEADLAQDQKQVSDAKRARNIPPAPARDPSAAAASRPTSKLPDAALPPAAAPAVGVRPAPAIAPQARAPMPWTPLSPPPAPPTRAPAPDSVVAMSPSATASPAEAEADPACKAKTVYLQVYGADDRERARHFRDPLRALGASVPPIEDVLATASARGTKAPLVVKHTTVRYHDIGSLNCAERVLAAVGDAEWRIEPLAPTLKARRNVLELWLAPPPAAGGKAP